MNHKTKLFFISLFSTCSQSFAQLAVVNNSDEGIIKLTHVTDSLYPALKGNFNLKYIAESPIGAHYTYIQTYKGLEIFGTYLKIHLNRKGNLIHFQQNIFDVKKNYEPTQSSANGVWVILENSLNQMQFKDFMDHNNNPWLLLLNENDTFRKFPLFLSFKDSMVLAKVYLPNPITSSHTTYGNPINDQNDANSLDLEAQLKEVNFKARYDNGKFLLQNDYLTMAEISNPTYSITQSAIPQYYYNRSQYQFEDVNAFYHLTFQIEYLKTLGYKKLIPNLRVDTHALQGADQSLFKFLSLPNTIEYGTGGVDDAEDAEVVVHEYGHALSQYASPNTTVNATMERLAMEEGWADYLAVSHFKKLDAYNWEKIFDWDGHNEFWEGINTNTGKHYPEDIQNRRDADREIWSTPLLCISDKLGKPLADSLLLQLLYFQTRDATMPLMAEKLIYIDTLLFYGDHYRAIKECFIESGILHKDHRDLFQGDISDKTNYRFVNTSGFANNDGPLGIKFNHKVDCIFSVYDLCGRLIIQQNYNRTDFIILEPEQFKSGLYLVKIEPKPDAKGYVNFYINEKVMRK